MLPVAVFDRRLLRADAAILSHFGRVFEFDEDDERIWSIPLWRFSYSVHVEGREQKAEPLTQMQMLDLFSRSGYDRWSADEKACQCHDSDRSQRRTHRYLVTN